MGAKRHILRALTFLADGKEGIRHERKRPVEDIMGDHVKFVFIMSVFASLVSTIVTFATAAYLAKFRAVAVDYSRLLNYSISIIGGTISFYFFAGTFLLFLISIILTLFIRIKYFELLRYLCLAYIPIISFAWINPQFVYALLPWGLIVFVSCLQTHNEAKKAAHATEQKMEH